MKKLSEMTLKELWELFPIFLTEHKDCWSEWYQEEKENILMLLSYNIKINHIGSTAIKGIWAKPIIDILVEVADEAQLNGVTSILQANGYLLMSKDSARTSLNKGYMENGFAERVFHIHIRLYGDNDEVYFRDYLNAHIDIAKEYEVLKLDLWKRYEHDRDGYTNAKTEFVRKYTDIARIEYKEENQ